MRQPDAQEAAVFLYIQAVGEVDGVIVAVPGEEAAFSQLGGEFERGVSVDAQDDRRATMVEALGSLMP